MIRGILAALLLLPLIAWCQSAQDVRAIQLYRELNTSASAGRLNLDIEELSTFGPRLAGSEGERAARDWMIQRLVSLGGVIGERQKVTLTVPQTREGSLFSINGQEQPVFPIWPNLVSTSGFSGAAATTYGGDGSFGALKGKLIRGRLVFLEFDSGSNWRWIAEQGAAAIVFLPARNGIANLRLEAEKKFAEVPVRSPRFFLAQRPPGNLDQGIARLECIQEWKRIPSENVEVNFSGVGDPILLTVATDAMSVVPDLSMGGEGAGSLAATVELVRLLRDIPNRRPIRVVLLTGHNLGLDGERAYVNRLIDRGDTILLAASVDLVSQTKTLGVFSRGLFYEPREEVIYGVRIFTTNLRDHATVMSEPMGFPDSRVCLQDITNNSDGRTWNKALAGKYALSSEVFLQAGLNAIAFSGVDDARARLDTPYDTADRVDILNLRSQTARVAACLARALIDSTDPSITDRYRLNLKPTKGKRFALAGGFATLSGQTLYYDPQKGFLPSVELPETLVTVKGRAKTFFGVRGAMVQATDDRARYRLLGLPPMTTYIPVNRGPTVLSAFRVDEVGRITMAAAEGIMGSDDYPTVFEIKTSNRQSPIVLFPCSTIDLFGLRDPQDQLALTDLWVFDSLTNGRPAAYGQYAAWSLDLTRPEEVEDAVTLFVKPGSRMKVLGGNDRLVITGRDEKGIGEEWSGSVAYQTAKDIHALNAARIALFQKHRILSPYADQVQTEVATELAAAEAAKETLDWPAFKRHANSAWALALRAYPMVKGSANDVVNGVVFYLLLLLPFSIFIERLLFGSRILTKRLAATVGVFLAVFMVLRYLHPAFEVVPNPWMVFIAFVMGALSLGVAVLIIGKFESGLSEHRAMRTGLREVTLRRAGAMAVSFGLALSNLRRRKLRTWLTATTLMFTTFLVIGFVGMVPEIKVLANRTPTKAPYAGLLVRSPAVDPLDPTLVARFETEFPNGISRRVFSYGADSGGLPTLSLYGVSDKAEVRALVGFDATEPTDVRGALISGRWFEKGETGVVIVPKDAAAKVGEKSEILGRQFHVIGAFDPSLLGKVRDLDGDAMMPPDFALSRSEQVKSQTATAAFRSYVRLDPAVCALMTADDVLSLNGQVRTIAVPLEESEVKPALDRLMPRLRMNLYAGAGGAVSQYSAQVGSTNAGLGLVLIQLVIAALFVMNTMLASVHERKGEIGILSAVGLAPNQIANLFFAESTVYGVLGAVGGYLIAQIVGRLAQALPALAGLTLNFSSTAAVLAALLVFATVMISTLYPARMGAKISSPDAAGSQEALPEGDEWTRTLPFTVGEADVEDLVRSFDEWFRSHEAFSVGVFVAQGVASDERGVTSHVSLVPFDLGVSQRVDLRMVPAEYVSGAFDLSIRLHRLSGDVRSWHSLNRAFFTQIRRHFLTWQASK